MKLADLIPQPIEAESAPAAGFNLAIEQVATMVRAAEAAGYILAHKSDVDSYAQQEAA